MTDRESVAKALAERVGWTLTIERDPTELWFRTRFETVSFPPPKAPLSDHLAFVGLVAETLPEGWALVGIDMEDPKFPDVVFAELPERVEQFGVPESGRVWKCAPDLSLAAALARLEVPDAEEGATT
jgi:hypothetical protein